MTSIFLLFLLMIFILVVTLVIRLTARRSSAVEISYNSCDTLCTPAERAFLGVLDMAVPDGNRIFAKVRLADLIKVGGGLKASLRQTAFNRISRKHVDFVLCRVDDIAITAAIELDDSSHNHSDRQDRDAFIDKAMASAGIPLIHFAAKRAYGVGEVRQAINGALGINTPPEADQVEADTSPEPAASSPPTGDFGACPKCGAPMVKRIVKKGPHAGKTILACSAFPKCRTVLPYREAEDSESAEIETPRFRMS